MSQYILCYREACEPGNCKITEIFGDREKSEYDSEFCPSPEMF